MTQAQERKVEMIRKEIEREFFPMHRNPEVKKFQVEELDCGIVSLIAEVGSVNDSDTYAAILCRERIHVFIGRKGSISYYPYSIKNGAKSRRLGRRSLYNVYYEQDIEESERRKLSQQRRREKEKQEKESTNE